MKQKTLAAFGVRSAAAKGRGVATTTKSRDAPSTSSSSSSSSSSSDKGKESGAQVLARLLPDLTDPDWLSALASEARKPYLAPLCSFVAAERKKGNKPVYPAAEDVFSALHHTKPGNVKVVLLGQDPYHGPGQAHGLSFSVRRGERIPASLRNIFKELTQDPAVDFKSPLHGNLEHWAAQGVLLLNDCLTVRASEPGSHQKKGWENFTDAVVAAVNAQDDPVVFLLFGKPAQKKGKSIDRGRHCVIEAPHPSPLSASRGFFGCGAFSQANDFLKGAGRGEIEWQIPS